MTLRPSECWRLVVSSRAEADGVPRRGFSARAEVAKRAGQPDRGSTASARARAAQERAAKEREARIKRAVAELPKARASKKKADEAKARVSTTDAEARVMKMGDGGFRPAYDVLLSTDVDSRVIVGVSVSNVGTDIQ